MNFQTPTDTAAGIFEPIFEVRVPQEALRSEMEVKVLGTPTTGNKLIDKAVSRARTTTYLNIATMAELSNDGWPVSVVKHEDCKRIYDLVQSHLDAWVRVLSNTINHRTAPYHDLYILDRFAQSVFAHARHLYNVPDNIENAFMRQIEELGLLGEFSIFQPSIENRKKTEASLKGETYEPSKRESLGEFFTAAMAGKRRLP